MQTGFAYYYFLMQEKDARSAAEVLADSDRDKDGRLSDNELLTVILQTVKPTSAGVSSINAVVVGVLV